MTHQNKKHKELVWFMMVYKKTVRHNQRIGDKQAGTKKRYTNIIKCHMRKGEERND